MQKIIIFLTLFFTCQFSFSNKLFELDAVGNSLYSEKTYKNLLDKELILYKKTKLNKHLLNIKYIEGFIYHEQGDDNKFIIKLLWVIEHSTAEDYLIYTHTNYHLSSLLSNLGSNNLAIKYSNEVIRNCLLYKISSLLCHSYSLKGSILYKNRNYETAMLNYFKSIKTDNKNDFLFKASMFNNISLCKMHLKDIKGSNFYIRKSLYYLSGINKNKQDKLFKIIVEGNLGSNYFTLKNYEKAKPLLEKELNFYAKNNINLSETFNLLEELLTIYVAENNHTKKTEILEKIIFLESSIQNKSISNRFTKVLYRYYESINDYNKLKFYSNKLLQNNALISDSVVKNLDKLNNLFYSQQIGYLKTQFKTNNKLYKSSLKSSQNNTFFILVLFSFMSAIFIILFIQKNKTQKRKKIILEQEHLLDENKRIILQNELKQKQEKITTLMLNLNLKKETEKTFLEKIKEIKRKRNSDIESVLKELQFSISNLLQIDNHNLNPNSDLEIDDSNFIKTLKEKHPNLLEHEINLCTYFRMNLNSKEIASIKNIADGTIRVYKTKLKQKIGLSANQKLNDYLKTLD